MEGALLSNSGSIHGVTFDVARRRTPPQPCRALCHRRAKMIDFYTKTLASWSQDGHRRRITSSRATPATTISRPGARRHRSRNPDVQQVSFNVSTLANVQRAYRKVTDAGCQGIARPARQRWSVYSRTPRQPDRDVCDTPCMCRSPAGSRLISTRRGRGLPRHRGLLPRPGRFKPIEEWRAEISKKIAEQLEA